MQLFVISLSVSEAQTNFHFCRTMYSSGYCQLKLFIRGNMYLITKTRLFKYIENLTTKNWKFSDKKF